VVLARQSTHGADIVRRRISPGVHHGGHGRREARPRTGPRRTRRPGSAATG
jgi:hypothetical protein